MFAKYVLSYVNIILTFTRYKNGEWEILNRLSSSVKKYINIYI